MPSRLNEFLDDVRHVELGGIQRPSGSSPAHTMSEVLSGKPSGGGSPLISAEIASRTAKKVSTPKLFRKSGGR
jgi:hypothetical protein